MEQRQSLALLIAELRKLCAAQSTGTFMVITEGNVALFVLEKGAIVAVTFKGKHGEEALPALRQITTGAPRFHKGVKLAANMPLPPTEALLHSLEPGAPGHSSSTPLARQQVLVASDLTPQMKAVLETTLATFVGPMASLLCAEHLARIHNIDEAIAALAEEIPDPESSRRFQNMVRNRL